MNLLNYLGPAHNELKLAIEESGFGSLEEYMEERKGTDMSIDERIAYHLGRVNLINEILMVLKEQMEKELGDEEEWVKNKYQLKQY